MNRHVNAISGRLSLRQPQRRSERSVVTSTLTRPPRADRQEERAPSAAALVVTVPRIRA